MFKKFLIGLQQFFLGKSLDDELEDFIAARNPQSAGDVEALERAFWNIKSKRAGYF